jgi:hypothetical protein
VAAALCLHADDPHKLVNRIDLPRWLGLSRRALAAVKLKSASNPMRVAVSTRSGYGRIA